MKKNIYIYVYLIIYIYIFFIIYTYIYTTTKYGNWNHFNINLKSLMN